MSDDVVSTLKRCRVSTEIGLKLYKKQTLLQPAAKKNYVTHSITDISYKDLQVY